MHIKKSRMSDIIMKIEDAVIKLPCRVVTPADLDDMAGDGRQSIAIRLLEHMLVYAKNEDGKYCVYTPKIVCQKIPRPTDVLFGDEAVNAYRQEIGMDVVGHDMISLADDLLTIRSWEVVIPLLMRFISVRDAVEAYESAQKESAVFLEQMRRVVHATVRDYIDFVNEESTRRKKAVVELPFEVDVAEAWTPESRLINALFRNRDTKFKSVPALSIMRAIILTVQENDGLLEALDWFGMIFADIDVTSATLKFRQKRRDRDPAEIKKLERRLSRLIAATLNKTYLSRANAKWTSADELGISVINGSVILDGMEQTPESILDRYKICGYNDRKKEIEFNYEEGDE